MQDNQTTALVINVCDVQTRAKAFFTQRGSEAGYPGSDSSSAKVYSDFKQELLGLLFSGKDQITISVENIPGVEDEVQNMLSALYVVAAELGFGITPPERKHGPETCAITVGFFDINNAPGTGARVIDISDCKVSPLSGEKNKHPGEQRST